jgi:hypothetical protein
MLHVFPGCIHACNYICQATDESQMFTNYSEHYNNYSLQFIYNNRKSQWSLSDGHLRVSHLCCFARQPSTAGDIQPGISSLDLTSASSSSRRPRRRPATVLLPRRPSRRSVVWISLAASPLAVFFPGNVLKSTCLTHSQTALHALFFVHSLS